MKKQTQAEDHTVKRFWLFQPYFGYLSCIPFVYLTHKVQRVLIEFEQNVVEQLPSFAKLVSPFRKPRNQHFGEVCCFFDFAHLLIESSLVAQLWLKLPGMYVTN